MSFPRSARLWRKRLFSLSQPEPRNGASHVPGEGSMGDPSRVKIRAV